MNRKKLILLLSSVFAFFIFLSFYLFSVSNDEKDSTKFQGGLSQKTLLQKENSLFDSGSDFLNFSGNPEEETAVSSTGAESEPAKPKSYLESLTPEEKAKLYERMYERFKPLVEKFPNNSLIPRKLTEAETAKRKEDEDHYYRVQREILERKDVPKDEMSFYLSTKLKRSDDMLEILKFGMENYQKAVLTQPTNPEYEKILKDRLDSISKGREEVINARKAIEP